MSTFTDLANAQLTIGDSHILWREIIGNGFGFASAVGGLRRRVWAWPVGIVGNVLLFTVFLGAAFGTPQGQNLLGQAGRQVMFIVVSVYGWYAWRQSRGSGKPAVEPRWATGTEVRWMVFAGAALVAVLTPTFAWIGSYDPVIADAWIFTGSLLATYAMARGWVDFWLIWIAVDAVGVPLLWRAQLYPSAILYLVYGALVVYGFTVWLKVSRQRQVPTATDPSLETVGG
jgi:nicotinamide mononucleotide transporter